MTDKEYCSNCGSFTSKIYRGEPCSACERNLLNKTKVYVAMVYDRHSDPEPAVFSTSDAAIRFARRTARLLNEHLECLKEEDVDGWMYYATYSYEGDSVWVLEKVIESE